ncbi:MAG: hypothetical protein ACOYNI_09025 [Acidimicrobiia bacterium]
MSETDFREPDAHSVDELLGHYADGARHTRANNAPDSNAVGEVIHSYNKNLADNNGKYVQHDNSQDAVHRGQTASDFDSSQDELQKAATPSWYAQHGLSGDAARRQYVSDALDTSDLDRFYAFFSGVNQGRASALTYAGAAKFLALFEFILLGDPRLAKFQISARTIADPIALDGIAKESQQIDQGLEQMRATIEQYVREIWHIDGDEAAFIAALERHSDWVNKTLPSLKFAGGLALSTLAVGLGFAGFQLIGALIALSQSAYSIKKDGLNPVNGAGLLLSSFTLLPADEFAQLVNGLASPAARSLLITIAESPTFKAAHLSHTGLDQGLLAKELQAKFDELPPDARAEFIDALAKHARSQLTAIFNTADRVTIGGSQVPVLTAEGIGGDPIALAPAAARAGLPAPSSVHVDLQAGTVGGAPAGTVMTTHTRSGVEIAYKWNIGWQQYGRGGVPKPELEVLGIVQGASV